MLTMNGNKMKYSDLFTPLQAFTAFILKNIDTIADKCLISSIEDLSMEFIHQHKADEETCILTLKHKENASLFICQLYNKDSYGFPITSLQLAKSILKKSPGNRIFLITPGLYPNLIKEVSLFNLPINYLVIDGNLCEFFPSQEFSNETNRTKID